MTSPCSWIGMLQSENMHSPRGDYKENKKFELMLTRHAKAYSSFGSVV